MAATRRIFLLGALAFACAGSLDLSAAPSSRRKCPYVGAISADAETGRVLFEDHADDAAYPASVTKLMTLFLVLEDVRAGKYALDDAVAAPREVVYSEASWIGLKAGDRTSVRDLCLALMVESANDAAIALGVRASGSFKAFVARMNARAKELGMASTTYCNPNGLPPKPGRYPWTEFNVSTARDLLKLALALAKMPEVFDFTSVKTADLVKTADGFRVSVTRRTNIPNRITEVAPGERIVKQLTNHNNVMRVDKLKILNPDGREAVDGFKTGYIDAGGSSVVMTGRRKGKRAIAIVLGSSARLDGRGHVVQKSSAVRDEHARRILSDALGALAW